VPWSVIAGAAILDRLLHHATVIATDGTQA
jgi:hypothetical protein